jgi:SAM-dependent methyltransferase
MEGTAVAMSSLPAESPGLGERDLWDMRYEKEGRIWGLKPSPTVRLLIDAIDQGPEQGRALIILDVGCGYGRDILPLIGRGHKVTGLDKSEKAALLAQDTVDQQTKGTSLVTATNFRWGTIETALARDITRFGSIYSHRTIHLFDDKEVSTFAAQAAKRLRPGGILCVGARSPKDFRPADMRWIRKGKTAEYKTEGRKGHVLNFWDEARFRMVFQRSFDIQFITESTEEESKEHPVPTSLTIMLARRRADQLNQVSGHGSGK